MLVAHFPVASKATGIRRQLYVLVYDNREQLRDQHARLRHQPPSEDVAGAVVTCQGFRWPQPDPTPVIVMLLWTGQLTTRTITHEATHAAAAFYFMDSVTGWDSRARAHLMGDHEPLAYLVGDLASEVIRKLYRLRLLPA